MASMTDGWRSVETSPDQEMNMRTVTIQTRESEQLDLVKCALRQVVGVRDYLIAVSCGATIAIQELDDAEARLLDALDTIGGRE
jgi:hypothetical protein